MLSLQGRRGLGLRLLLVLGLDGLCVERVIGTLLLPIPLGAFRVASPVADGAAIGTLELVPVKTVLQVQLQTAFAL